jgi:hypothetical protein
MFLRNVGIYLQAHRALQTKISISKSLPPWGWWIHCWSMLINVSMNKCPIYRYVGLPVNQRIDFLTRIDKLSSLHIIE